MPRRDVVLVAEDSDEDFFFLERAANDLSATISLERVMDGQQAIDYLTGAQQQVKSEGAKLPKLLLLDLKMPTIDGFGVLQWLATQEQLKHLPVVVFTNSEQTPDIRRAYDLGANGFTTKAESFDGLKEQVSALQSYWVKQNRVCHEPT